MDEGPGGLLDGEIERERESDKQNPRVTRTTKLSRRCSCVRGLYWPISRKVASAT